jgi:hypothetical protein
MLHCAACGSHLQAVPVGQFTVSVTMSFANFDTSGLLTRSRHSIVGIATGYRLDDRRVGVRVPVGSRIFSFPRRPGRLWGPTNFLSNGYRGSSPRVKRPGREADNSPPVSAEVKKMWIYTSTPPYTFIGQCLITYAHGKNYPYLYSLFTALTAVRTPF